MKSGTVKWFDSEKGFGFIRPDGNGAELFVHHTGINGSGYKSLEAGERVSYDTHDTAKGLQARNVTKLPSN